jgi:serine protease Do
MKVLTKAAVNPYALVAVGLVVGAGAFFALNKSGFAQGTLDYKPMQRTASLGQAPKVPKTDLEALDQFYADLSTYASEAVVHIRVGGQGRGRMAMMQSGDGSGFILTQDGWIVTNDHVVRNADEVAVFLADGRELKGKVTRANDESLDVALIKVDAKNLPVLKFADSDAVKPGQIVIAVGSPFGLENTVTFGHVSAIGRPGQASDGIQAPRYYSGMIQTDASINPGNSGGPLINVYGEVIGVNTSIYSTSGASAGIGFAIPANVVRAVANELIETGKFDRGLMGVEPRDLKPFESKERDGLVGAYVNAVSPGDSAEKAGLKPGDVITKVDGDAITNEIDLRVALYKKSPNEKVTVTYKRDGAEKTATITLKAPQVAATREEQPQMRPDAPFREMPNFPDIPEFMGDRPKLGVYLYDVDDTTREQYKLPGGLEGAVIYRVSAESIAAKAGLKPGDVITSIDGQRVTAADDVVNTVSELELGDQVTIKYTRMQDGKAVERSVDVRFR